MSGELHATKVYELETGRVYRYAGADCQGMKAAERFRALVNAPSGPRALDELAADGGAVAPLREFDSGDLVWVQHVGFVSSLPVHDNAAEWRLCVVCCQVPVLGERRLIAHARGQRHPLCRSCWLCFFARCGRMGRCLTR